MNILWEKTSCKVWYDPRSRMWLRRKPDVTDGLVRRRSPVFQATVTPYRPGVLPNEIRDLCLRDVDSGDLYPANRGVIEELMAEICYFPGIQKLEHRRGFVSPKRAWFQQRGIKSGFEFISGCGDVTIVMRRGR